MIWEGLECFLRGLSEGSSKIRCTNIVETPATTNFRPIKMSRHLTWHVSIEKPHTIYTLTCFVYDLKRNYMLAKLQSMLKPIDHSLYAAPLQDQASVDCSGSQEEASFPRSKPSGISTGTRNWTVIRNTIRGWEPNKHTSSCTNTNTVTICGGGGQLNPGFFMWVHGGRTEL